MLYLFLPFLFLSPTLSILPLSFDWWSLEISKFGNRNTVFLFLSPPFLRVGKEIFHEKFPRSSESGLWYSHGNPLCRGYNQLNTSTPFNPVIVDTVHARTKGVVDFKLPLKLASSRRNLIPSRFTYREREAKREENDFGSMGITDEANNLLSWNFFVMVIAYDRCSYVNPLFIFKFLYLSFIIFREKCAWQRYILSLRDLEAKLRSEIVWNYCEAREFFWGCHPLQSFSLCILI